MNPNFSYRCNYYRQHKSCPNSAAITEHKIEKQLLDNLNQYVQNEIAKVKAITEKKRLDVDNTAKIEAVKKEMSRLNTMFRKGRIEEAEYDKDYAVQEKELKTLEAVGQPEERDLTALKKLMESDYRTIYDALDKTHKRAFWRKIIKEFTIGADRKIDPESIIFF